NYSGQFPLCSVTHTVSAEGSTSAIMAAVVPARRLSPRSVPSRARGARSKLEGRAVAFLRKPRLPDKIEQSDLPLLASPRLPARLDVDGRSVVDATTAPPRLANPDPAHVGAARGGREEARKARVRQGHRPPPCQVLHHLSRRRQT